MSSTAQKSFPWGLIGLLFVMVVVVSVVFGSFKFQQAMDDGWTVGEVYPPIPVKEVFESTTTDAQPATAPAVATVTK